MIEPLYNYLSVITIPFVILWIFINLLPDKAFPLKLFTQLLVFIFVRDSMITTGCWSIKSNLEMKFIENPSFLYIVSVLCLCQTFLIYFVNCKYLQIVMTRTYISKNLLFGCGGALLIYLPVFIFKNVIGAKHDSSFDFNLIFANLCIALTGNFTEEILFRSYLISYLKSLNTTSSISGDIISNTQCIMLSGLAFAAFHVYLAYIVTETGTMVIVFTLYEGIICALLESNQGLIASTVAHGIAIFFISTNFMLR
jgi:hypothetical protein